MRTAAFWVVTAVSATVGLLATAVAFHQVSILGARLVRATRVEPGASAIGYAVLVGVAAGSARTLESVCLARWFGVARIGSLRGVVMAVTVAASALGPLPFGVAFDRTGSYEEILFASALVPVLVGVAAMAVRPPGPGGRSGGRVEPATARSGRRVR